MNKRESFTELFNAALAVIFDFDGVIADSERYHFLAYRDVFARYGHTVDEREYYKYWTSLGLGPRGEIERHHLDLDPTAIRDEKRPTFSEYCRSGAIRVYNEIPAILERLSRAGLVLAVASGTSKEDITAVLDNAGLRGYFSVIVGCDEIPAIKPAPDVFLAAMKRLGMKPSECLVIEDAEKGVTAARAARVPVIVVRTNETRAIDFSDADLVLDSLAELLTLIPEGPS